MKKKNLPQQEQKTQLFANPRFRGMLITYFDIVIRSLISFFCIGVLFSIFLIGFLHITWVIVLPLVFIASIIVAPFLSKIKLGEVVFSHYESWLKKTFKLQ